MRQMSLIIFSLILVIIAQVIFPPLMNARDEGKPAQSTGATPNGLAPAAGTNTEKKVRTVTSALLWLSNHQSKDGSWSLQDYTDHCKDAS